MKFIATPRCITFLPSVVHCFIDSEEARDALVRELIEDVFWLCQEHPDLGFLETDLPLIALALRNNVSTLRISVVLGGTDQAWALLGGELYDLRVPAPSGGKNFLDEARRRSLARDYTPVGVASSPMKQDNALPLYDDL